MMSKRQICFTIEEDLLKQIEEIRYNTGLPISRQIELQLSGYNIIKDEKTVIQLRKITVKCLKKIGKKGETYDDIIRRLICEIYPELKPKNESD